MGNSFVELPVDKIELDKTNPRIALGMQRYKNMSSDIMALLLGTTSEACASLRESIREHGGIVNPIIVNHTDDDRYVVIEGNTRLQIYKDFIGNNEPGCWTKIRAIVYENMATDKVHAIRLQAHLIGPREWDPYSKARYLTYLSEVEHMPMNRLISFCGGNAKASEVRSLIAAYKDMEKYYRVLCDEDNQFDIRKFHGFVELQNDNVLESLKLHGYTKTDFSQWMKDGRFSILADVRVLSDILNSKKAKDIFLKENSAEAKKMLAVESFSSNKLKDVPYDVLAKELIAKMKEISVREITHLRTDSDYQPKLQSLVNVCKEINFVLEEVHR